MFFKIAQRRKLQFSRRAIPFANANVLLDRAKGYDKTEGNWTDTKILRLNPNTKINDDIIVELGEKDTSDCATLQNFLNFVALIIRRNILH